MNVVILIGRLTKDPELKQTSSNLVYCRFTIAVDRPFSKDNATDFINCVAWRKQAENLCKYQKKGNLIGVTGSIQVNNYRDKDGKMQYLTDIVANNIQFLSSRQDRVNYASEYPSLKPQDFISKQQQQQQQEIIEPDIQEYEIESYTVNNDDLPF